MIYATVAQLVEYDLAKVGVAGSSPVCRSFERISKRKSFFVMNFRIYLPYAFGDSVIWKEPGIHLALSKQMTGIEPASSAWEADVLPMNYICELP